MARRRSATPLGGVPLRSRPRAVAKDWRAEVEKLVSQLHCDRPVGLDPALADVFQAVALAIRQCTRLIASVPYLWERPADYRTLAEELSGAVDRARIAFFAVDVRLRRVGGSNAILDALNDALTIRTHAPTTPETTTDLNPVLMNLHQNRGRWFARVEGKGIIDRMLDQLACVPPEQSSATLEAVLPPNVPNPCAPGPGGNGTPQKDTIPVDLQAARDAVRRLLDHLASVTEHLRSNPHTDLTQIEELNGLITEADNHISPVRSDLNEACPKRPNDHDEALQLAREFVGFAEPFFRDGRNPSSIEDKWRLGQYRSLTYQLRPIKDDYPRLDYEIRQAVLRRAEKCHTPPAPGAGENEPHADGPEGGRWVWVNGVRHDVPKGNVYRLITHFWNRESANYDDLTGSVFVEEVLYQTIRSEVSETNAVLRTIGIPWGLTADSRNRFVTKGPLKPLRIKTARAKRKKRGSKLTR